MDTKTRIWTDFDEQGAVSFSDVCRYNEFGRESDCESFSDNGFYDYTQTYDLEDGLIKKRRRFNKNTDEVSDIVDFVYDENRNQLQRTYLSQAEMGGFVEYRKVIYTYDADNRKVKRTESFNGGIAIEYTYQYNELGQVKRIETVSDNGIEDVFQAWEYDDTGNIKRRVAVDGSGSTTTEYQYEKSPFTVVNHMLRILEFWL